MRLPIPRRLAQVAYLGQQTTLQVSCGALQHILRRVVFGTHPQLRLAPIVSLRRRYLDLVRQDLANVDAGYYPTELLFQIPWRDYLGRLPRLGRDLPRVARRIREGNWRDLPTEVDLDSYPPYYRRTFHWQTDGYLSRHSACLYDLGVELLFIGVADVMRRQALADVMQRKAPGPIRMLDVGTGTGRFLAQAAAALPGSEIVGVDLSPWYVEHAREQLGSVAVGAPRVQVANAEALPFADESFDVVTSIFLLHELPRRVRRVVLTEMRRVLKSGGLIVLEDAAQPSDAPELRPVLEQFSKDMHEPFFADYQRDDLTALLEDAGFSGVRIGSHFVAKVASARKSDGPRSDADGTPPGPPGR